MQPCFSFQARIFGRPATFLFCALVALLPLSTNAAPPIEPLALTCFSCHGVNGLSHGPATPIIAGLSKNYFIGAMLSYAYADDLDKADAVLESDPSLKDVRLFKRSASMMANVAKAYSLEEMTRLAAYFSKLELKRPKQVFSTEKADAGAKTHKKYCEKCHEEGGRSTEDDVGLLAGQWIDYLSYTLEDVNSGDREIPKKMSKKMEKLLEDKGKPSLEELTHFYASEQ